MTTATSAPSIVENARLLYMTGRCDPAVALLAQALEQDPSQRHVRTAMCELLIDSGRYEAALQLLPDEEGDANLRAFCCEASGDVSGAERIVDRLLAVDGRCALSLVVKARILVRAGQAGLAEELFRRAIASDPDGGWAYWGLGQLQRARGRHAESLDWFESAFQRCPQSRDMALALHAAALAAESHPRGEAIFRKALHQRPLDRRLRFLLTDLLLRQRKHAEAMAEIESSMADFGVDDGILAAALSVRQRIGAACAPGRRKNGGTVSLCMIVKNEEKHLPRCLRCARPIVDEIVVVDTGSTDRTRDIASAFGARVFDFPWNDDFAAARNFSLTQAAGDWILVLDADELISPNDHEAFRALIDPAAPAKRAFRIRTRNYTRKGNTVGWQPNRGEYPEEEGLGWFPSDKVRLFPNDPRIRFVHPVHELVEPTLRRWKIGVDACPIPVHHFGQLEEARTIEKTQAYRDLERKKLTKNASDPAALRELAIQSAHLEKHEEALAFWKQYARRQPRSAEAFVNMGSACWSLGRYAEAARHAERAHRLDPSLKEAPFNRAIAWLMMGRAGEAKAILQPLLSRHPHYSAAQFMMCVVCACLGEGAVVAHWLGELRATPLGPHLGTSFFDAARRLFAASQLQYARRTLEAARDHRYSSDAMTALLDACRVAA